MELKEYRTLKKKIAEVREDVYKVIPHSVNLKRLEDPENFVINRVREMIDKIDNTVEELADGERE
jgi:hypothetical protein